MRTVERKNTERDAITLGEVEKLFDLRLHYVSVTESAVQDGLVEYDGQLQWMSRVSTCCRASLASTRRLARWADRDDPFQVAVGHMTGERLGLEQRE